MKRISCYPTHNRRFSERSKLKYRLFLFWSRSCLFLCAAAAIFFLFFTSKKNIFPPIPSCPDEWEGFRQMKLEQELMAVLSELSNQTDTDKYKLLAVLMASAGFYFPDDEYSCRLPHTLAEYDIAEDYYEKRYQKELALLQSSYQTLLADIKYFPVMKSSRDREQNFSTAGIAYADGWLAERNYQNSSHLHEGTDIMALNNRRGYYPIVSMTDGVVENIGWLEKGGYRVGIRSPHGAYFYYAHLYRYADGLEKGSVVQAGQLLGFMGDSGYSKVEGTVGNFDVHLHLGIYLKTSHYEELSVNPYWILKLVESDTVIGNY